MTRDAEAVLALLRTLTIWYPSGVPSFYGGSGEVFTHKEPCGQCGGQGRIGKQKQHTCPRCKGKGYRRVDRVTERSADDRVEHRRQDVTTPCDGCAGEGCHPNGRRCEHCDGAGIRLGGHRSPQDATRRETESRLPRSTFGHVEGTRWLNGQGDYAGLGRALLRLERERPATHSLILHLVVYQERPIDRADLQRYVDEGCELLARWMGGHVRAPGWATSKPVNGNARGRGSDPRALAQRDNRIRELRAAGWKISRLAREWNLSERQTKRICAP